MAHGRRAVFVPGRLYRSDVPTKPGCCANYLCLDRRGTAGSRAGRSPVRATLHLLPGPFAPVGQRVGEGVRVVRGPRISVHTLRPILHGPTGDRRGQVGHGPADPSDRREPDGPQLAARGVPVYRQLQGRSREKFLQGEVRRDGSVAQADNRSERSTEIAWRSQRASVPPYSLRSCSEIGRWSQPPVLLRGDYRKRGKTSPNLPRADGV